MKQNRPLGLIQRAFRETRYVYSIHAVDQSTTRHITRTEIEEAILSGEIVERYPHDKYGPSCLIFGKTQLERSLHIVCTIPVSATTVKIITVYEPDPKEWINFKKRK